MENRSRNSLWYYRRIPLLYALWWCTDIALGVVMLMHKISLFYLVPLLVVSGLIQYLVRKFLSPKGLVIFFVCAIVISIALIVWIVITKEVSMKTVR